MAESFVFYLNLCIFVARTYTTHKPMHSNLYIPPPICKLKGHTLVPHVHLTFIRCEKGIFMSNRKQNS